MYTIYTRIQGDVAFAVHVRHFDKQAQSFQVWFAELLADLHLETPRSHFPLFEKEYDKKIWCCVSALDFSCDSAVCRRRQVK